MVVASIELAGLAAFVGWFGTVLGIGLIRRRATAWGVALVVLGTGAAVAASAGTGRAAPSLFVLGGVAGLEGIRLTSTPRAPLGWVLAAAGFSVFSLAVTLFALDK